MFINQCFGSRASAGCTTWLHSAVNYAVRAVACSAKVLRPRKLASGLTMMLVGDDLEIVVEPALGLEPGPEGREPRGSPGSAGRCPRQCRRRRGRKGQRQIAGDGSEDGAEHVERGPAQRAAAVQRGLGDPRRVSLWRRDAVDIGDRRVLASPGRSRTALRARSRHILRGAGASMRPHAPRVRFRPQGWHGPLP